MKSLRACLILLATPTILAGVFALTIAAGQEERRLTSTQQQEIDENQYPIAKYTTIDEDIGKSALRRSRSSHYDVKDKNIKKETLRKYMLTEESPQKLLPLPSSHAETEPALPILQSDAIISGEVVDAQAYLSNDKTTVYSEFTVQVDEVLKDDSLSSLSPGMSVVTERLGGRVRLPSGKILLRGGHYGHNMPQIGRRYLLFLEHHGDSAEAFSIITGYELRADGVRPLDGTGKKEDSKQFAGYESFNGMDETTSLLNVRNTISQPQTNNDGDGGRDE